MTCWKCGKSIDTGVECSGCENGVVSVKIPEVVILDWNKVVTFEDMRKVMSIIGVYVATNSPKYQQLKPWLRRLTPSETASLSGKG